MSTIHRMASAAITRGTIQRVAQAVSGQAMQWARHGPHFDMARAIAEALADELKDELERAEVSREIFLAACGVA